MFFSNSMILWLSVLPVVAANPMSDPYIPFRTSPLKQSKLHHILEFEEDTTRSRSNNYDISTATADDKCPLQFSLGVSKRVHNSAGLGILQPPVIFPALPSHGPGRQVLYVTQYEHLDMLTPSISQPFAKDVIKEALVQHVEFPMLFESSAFLTSPILRDVNNDGIVDAVLTDYDGGIYAMGLQVGSDNRRYFHKAQVPRLYVRRHWMESLVNETLGLDLTDTDDDSPMDRETKKKGTHDPYHSYFEYTYGTSHEHEKILRGVTANVFGLEQKHVETLNERRKRKVFHNKANPDEPASVAEDGLNIESEDFEATHRRLQEVIEEPALGDNQQQANPPNENADARSEPDNNGDQLVEGSSESERKAAAEQMENAMLGEDQEVVVTADKNAQDGNGESEKAAEIPEEIHFQAENEERNEGFVKDDDYLNEEREEDREGEREEEKEDYSYSRYGGADDDAGRYPRHDDDYPRYDDYYGRYGSERNDYYDEKHYIRITPHILCTPVLAEFPKLYSDNGGTENFLFVAVSYYMDEDEYEGLFSYHRFESTDHGDESEVQRGMYVANALVVYQFGEHPRWGRQEHLDLSGDHSSPVNTTLVGSIPLQHENTKMGAFALSSPTVADIDGDGNYEVLMGTSMGIVYCFDARNLYTKENWPVQFMHGIESRILVEDVLGDTNLEMFVSDVGGNVACLDHKANKLWHRDLVSSVTTTKGGELLASSQMVLGDVNGDGLLDLVVIMKIREPGRQDMYFIFALSASTGRDLPNFPMQISGADVKNEDIEGEEFVHQKLPAPLLVDLHANQDFVSSYLKRNGTEWVQPSRSETNTPPQGGNALGLHVVVPIGSDLIVMEAGSGCIQTVSIGDPVLSMVQADDVHGTNGLDLVIATASGNIVTLESPAPFHPLNVWNNGEVRGSTNAFAHGYSASQGIFIHGVSRQFRDIFGAYIPVTFEIFDNRPNIKNEPGKRVYNVEIRIGTSLPLFRQNYASPGIYTERFYIPFGPGYYTLSLVMKTSHGLLYEDTFHLGYNVNYMAGFATMLWLPLVIAATTIFMFGRRNEHWDDEDYNPRNGNSHQGILDGRIS